MKVVILSDAQSVHTKRWVLSLKESGIDVVLYSIKPAIDDYFERNNVKSHYFDLFTYKENDSLFDSFLKHREAVRDLKRVLSVEKPDILHSHFLTSYSLIAALSGYKPLVVSVWGSDIYDFPRRSLINGLSVKYILSRADAILSTSKVMAIETGKYTSKKIYITPFGVDTSLFRKTYLANKSDCFTIGTVKTLSYKYGIDVLIKAFKIVCDRNCSLNLNLKIVGEGTDMDKLKDLAFRLGISDKVKFVGFVPNSEVYKMYNSFDIAVFLSFEESFGVSAVEAMSCECPVVVSDAEGFTEIVEDGVTGFVVPRFDENGAAIAIQQYIDDRSLIGTMGKAARERVIDLYDWKNNVDTMISIYHTVLKEFKNE